MRLRRLLACGALAALLLASAVQAAPVPQVGQAVSLPALSLAGGAKALAGLANWDADSCLAASDNRPLVLFFTLPGCRFCDDVRQRYMLPLARDGELVREIVIDSDRPVTGFAGAATQRGVASKMGVKVAPVVLVVDASGHPLADAVVGGDVAGLYGGSLDNALALAARRLVMDAEGHGGGTSAASQECQH